MRHLIQNVTKNNKSRKVILLSLVISMLAIIMLVITLLFFRKPKVQNNLYTPELSRARSYAEVESGEEAVEGTDNVKFDAFFLRDIDEDGYAEKIRGTCKEIGKTDNLYMELNVQTSGYLKDGKITINSETFSLQTTLPKDKELKNNYISNNLKEIEFNDFNSGTQKLITGIVKFSSLGNNINNYSKTNSVTLTGTYVGEDGTEVPISKTVEFNIDWYGTTAASISIPNQTAGISSIIKDGEKVELEFTVYTQETKKQLILKSNHVEGIIPELNGYAPIDVTYTGSGAIFKYDAETREFTIDSESVVSESGSIINTCSTSYGIKISYPIEAYQNEDTVQITIPVSTYYEGYNNQNEEFTNPYKSNIAQGTIIKTYLKPNGTVAKFEVTVENSFSSYSKISKEKPLNIYNGKSAYEDNDIYTVRWYATTGDDGQTSGMIMKETKIGETQVADKFVKTNGTEDSMENVTTNIGIYFSNPNNMLGENGWIKVYDDESDELIATFTSSNWNNYSSTNPYEYETPVKHIRVETSNTNANNSIYVYNVKKLDDTYITENYTEEEFSQLQYIKSTLVGYLGENYINTNINQASYETPYSTASISISKNTISTQETEENLEIRINATGDENKNQVKWLNGSFLVKLPSEIIDVQLKNITINNSSVKLESYEVLEENGEKFIKILTQNTTPQTFTIIINTDITPDPRIATTAKQIELYSANENQCDYSDKIQDIYDVNNNLNTEEQVNYSTTSIKLVAPNSLLTNQTASNYDDKNSIVVSPQISELRPMYAVVDQEQEEKTVTIGVQIRNNYTSSISEINILGKIPFEGNTYVINGADLNSTFTTKMKSSGIEIPEELQGIAKVYYSENENPDKDLNNQSNGWVTYEEIENWDNIKTYLIDLGDYIMPVGKEYVFNYIVIIPNDIEFNEISYSHHGVYFSLDTENGKYRTQTEPNKLGIRIAEKYDLELSKYQTNKDKLVQGATYSIKEIIIDEDGNEVEGTLKTGLTGGNGSLTITNLYAEKIYEIREIKSPTDYELNSDVIRFITHVDDHGILTIEKLSGTTKGNVTVIKNEGENYKVKINVEDEVKASLKITKTEENTGNRVAEVKYRITGDGISQIITTDINGEATVNGLSIGQEYTLEEVMAEGYYLSEKQIKFRIVNNNGNYAVELIQGNIVSKTITEEDDMPTLNMILEDKKIPRYNLQINKVEKGEETPVVGAKFRLYKDDIQIGAYTTDENGKIIISDLYQYESAKNIDQTYTLKETEAPDGYSVIKDITFKVENIEGLLTMDVISGTIKEQKAEGNNIIITLEDSLSFKLIKKDGETGEVLPNTKFAIYNVDNGIDEIALDAKYNILGTKEEINGEEYYTVTTNEKGEIEANLREGLYKAVEVKASDDKYDITNNVYYFGIGASRETEQVMIPYTGTSIGGSETDYIYSVASTSDGGYVAGGEFYGTIDLGNGITLDSKGSSVGVIIKYSSSDDVEWATVVNGNNWNNINSVSPTNDGGYVAGGQFSGTIDLGNGIVLDSNGTSAGMIIKYNSNGQVEWATSVGGNSGNNINSVASTSDGGIVAGGYFSGTVDLGNVTILDSKGSFDGMIIKYSSNGEIEWATSVGGSSSDYINSIASTSDGGIVAGGYFSGIIELRNGITLESKGSSNGMIVKYDTNGNIELAKSIEGSNVFITSIASTSDGGYIVGGEFSGTVDLGNVTILDSKGDSDGMIIKYSSNGQVEWAKSIEGTSNNEIRTIVPISDGGYVAGGYFYGTIDLGNVITLTSKGSYNGMIIKYSNKGNAEWATLAGGSDFVDILSVAEANDGKILAAGGFMKNIQTESGEIVSNGEIDGMILNIITCDSIPEVQELTVENVRKEFKITTDVNVIEDIKGGNISGEDEKPYEIVKYGDDSAQEIVMTPEDGYEIIKITVNGKEYPFESNEDGTYIMPQFTNMKEDKHIEVTYALTSNKIVINKISEKGEPLSGIKFKLEKVEERNDSEDVIYYIEVETNSNGQAITQIPYGKYSITEINTPEEYKSLEEPVIIEFNNNEHKIVDNPNTSNASVLDNGEFVIENIEKAKVIVHHYLKDRYGNYTEISVADDEIFNGEIEERYTAIPNMDLEEYDLEKDENGEYVVPENATGIFTEDVIEVIYYYEEKTVELTVYHYIEGTTQQVPLVDGSKAEDEEKPGYEGETYETEPISEDKLADEYELVEIPENSTGIYTKEKTIVIYYYKLVERNVSIQKYQMDGTTALEGAKFTIEKAGENNEEESEIYVTDSEGKINVTLGAGTYEITEVEAPKGYMLPENPTTTIEITRDTEENLIVDIINERIKGTVTAHYYIKGTEEKVPLADGTYAEDEIMTDYIGNTYTTKEKENISSEYELVEIVGQTTGNYIEGNIDVTYYYQKKTKVIVKYIDKITGEEISEEVTEEGLVGDKYTSEPKDIDDYVLVEKPEEETVVMTEDVIVLKYYYKKISAGVTEKHIDIKSQEVLDETLYEGTEGTPYTTKEKDFEGYDLVEELYPENAEGTMTVEPIEVKYYYIRKASLLVEYIDKETGEKLTESEKTEGHEGDTYKTEEKDFDNYELVEVPENAEGTLDVTTDDEGNVITETVVRYYYQKKEETKVVEKHIDIKSNELLEEETVYTGFVGDSYKTSSKTFEGYDVVKEKLPENAEGTMTAEPIEVKYYYIRKASLLVEYIDKETGEKLTESERTEGHEGDTYKTKEKDFEDYELIEVPENAEGTLNVTTDDEGNVVTETVVRYYYQKKEKAKVIVKYIDKITGEEIAEEITEEGYVGDEYTSIPKDIDDYVLVEKPEEETVVMTEEVIVLKYYYEKISAGVIEKHIDIKSEEILDNTVYEGTEGTPYTTKEKDFEGYDLVEELYPENAEGIMTVDVIEVKYYYIRKASLLVEYIDKETGEKLTESERTEGHEGDTYKTKEKDFEDYELIEVPENAEGTLDVTTDDEGNVVTETVVRYYYKHKEETKVIEKHVDIETNELLEEETVYTGFVGDSYKTSSKTFEGYELVEEKLPENAEGTMTADTIEVIYYYFKKQPDVEPPKEKVTIRVEHLEVGTEKKLAEDDVIVGEEGDNYTTNSKNIDGYTLVKDRIPNNKDGIMKDGIVVKYYYEANKVEIPEPTKPEEPVQPAQPSTSTTIITENKTITTTTSSNTEQKRLPDTGDDLPITTITTILFVIALNIVVTATTKQHSKKGRRLK